MVEARAGYTHSNLQLKRDISVLQRICMPPHHIACRVGIGSITKLMIFVAFCPSSWWEAVNKQGRLALWVVVEMLRARSMTSRSGGRVRRRCSCCCCCCCCCGCCCCCWPWFCSPYVALQTRRGSAEKPLLLVLESLSVKDRALRLRTNMLCYEGSIFTLLPKGYQSRAKGAWAKWTYLCCRSFG